MEIFYIISFSVIIIANYFIYKDIQRLTEKLKEKSL